MSRRKAEMILELVDRATRPARRFIALQRRMGDAVERANRQSQRSSRAAERATDLYRRAVRGLDRAQDALQRGIRRSNDLIRRQITQLRTASGLMRNGAMGMGRAALLAGGMFTAYAGSVGLAGAAMLGPARQFERFQTILTTTEGSAGAAQEAMAWVQSFATTTPYDLDEVTEAFVQLRSYGLDPTNGLLRSLGDASAAMGRDVGQAVEAIADAVVGENERLKEFGVRASAEGDFFEYTYMVDGIERVARAARDDRAEIEAVLTGIFNERFGGSMEQLSQTFDGMLSNIRGIWLNFQLMIMSSGVFDWLKDKLGLLLDTLNAWNDSGELEAFAERIGQNMIAALEALWSFGEQAISFWQRFYPYVEWAADALGGWRNLALAALAIPFRGILFGAAAGLAQFAIGALGAGRALGAIGFLSAGKGALALGAGLLSLLNPINIVRGAFIALRFALLATGIGAIVLAIAAAGTWIYNNWSGLGEFFTGFGEAFMEALGPAAPIVEGVVSVIESLWDWVSALLGPIDASAETWRAWGEAAGHVVGTVVGSVAKFVGNIFDWFAALPDVDWGSLFTLEGLRTAWTSVVNFVTGTIQRLWELHPLSSLQWADVVSGLEAAWGAVVTFVTGIVQRLWELHPLSSLQWADVVSGLEAAWDAVVSFVTGIVQRLWELHPLSSLQWADVVSGLEAAWDAVVNFVTTTAQRLWELNPLTSVDWTAVLDGLQAAWDSVVSFFRSISWTDILPDWNWSAIIPDLPDFSALFGGPDDPIDIQLASAAGNVFGQEWERGIELVEQYRSGALDAAGLAAELQAFVASNQGSMFDGFEVNQAQDMLHVLEDVAGIAPPQIVDPESLVAAAAAAEELEGRFPALNSAAVELQNTVTAMINTIIASLAALNLQSEGQRLAQSLADGLRAGLEPVRAAAQALANTIRQELPSSATLHVAAATATAPVQARAAGGPFGPGWLLTGENGPELEYRSRGGFIAHNQALQDMVAMSETVTRNAANANRGPNWLRGAALASGLATSATVAAAALDPAVETGTGTSTVPGAPYLTERNSGGSVSVSAPITLTIQGNVDPNTMPDLTRALEGLETRLMERIQDEARATRRREHD